MPLLGEALEVWGSSECGDGAKQFAGVDRDVQRQLVEQFRTGVGVQAAGDVGLEPGDGSFDGFGDQAVETRNDAGDVVGEVVEFAGREVANDDRERDTVGGAGLDDGDLPDGASEFEPDRFEPGGIRMKDLGHSVSAAGDARP